MLLVCVALLLGSADGAGQPQANQPAAEQAGPQASDVVLDQVARVSNVLSGPAPTLAFTNFFWALGAAMKANNLKWGTWGVFANAFYLLGMAMLPVNYVAPYFAEPEKHDPNYVPEKYLESQVYLLDFSKKSALTGSLKREPKGRGLGWDLATETTLRKSGVVYGFAGIYQQTNIDSTEWATVYNLFLKLDAHVGWNGAAALGYALGSPWLARQELSVRVGPSYFRNWVSLSDEGSGVFQDPGEYVGGKALIASGTGYELSANAAVDFGIFGGASFLYQRGSYPALNFGSANPETAALLVLVGMDDLRQGKTYTWERMRAELNIPFTGYARSGSFNIAASLSKQQNDKGASVSNRGFSLGGSWRF